MRRAPTQKAKAASIKPSAAAPRALVSAEQAEARLVAAERARVQLRALRGPGRPRREDSIESLHDYLSKGAAGTALSVYVRWAKLGGARGALTRAVNEIAREKHKGAGAVRKAAARYPEFRELALNFAAFEAQGDELERRTRGIPEDVLQRMGGVSAGWALAFLRRHKIEFTPPQWLLDMVRGGGWPPSN